MNTKGKGIGMGTIAILAVVALAVGYLVMNPNALSGFGPAAVPLPGKVTPAAACSSNTTPELEIVALDYINQGTSRTGDMNAVIFLNGAYNSNYALTSDNTVDVSPGDGYTIFLVGNANQYGYLGQIATGNVPCEERVTINMYTPAVGTSKVTFYNEDDGLVNSNADKQTIGSGETVNVSFDIKANSADQCIGTKNSTKELAFCMDFNSNVFKTPVLKIGGANAPSLSVPEGHTSLRSSFMNDTACYKLSGYKEVCDFGKITGLSLQLQAKSGQNPTYKDDDLNTWVYMPQIDKQQETNVWDFVYTDEIDANVIIMPGHMSLFTN